MEFIAATWNIYDVPLVNPVTVYEVEVEPVFTGVDHETPPLVECLTEYPVIAEPPFDAGAVQDNATWELPDVPETLVGAPGTVACK